MENDPAPKERKNPERERQENELKRAQAAIAGAERGNWRDLRTVFEFAGIDARTPAVNQEQNRGGPKAQEMSWEILGWAILYPVRARNESKRIR
jgi:hypothetical protein